MITHYDLFAGIGGFSLALEEVFDEPIRHIFCEWERFPTAVLKRHWPDGEFWGDISDLVTHTDNTGLAQPGWSRRQKDAAKVKTRLDDRPQRPDSLTAHPKRTGRAGSIRQAERRNRLRSGGGSDQKQDWTIVTGGFPCQPFSHAGRRKGTADDRYQWPNMFAVIRHTKPEWVIAENVRGLVTWNEGLVLETVCADLESEGYEVQPFIIPAVAVGAPHRRDRVWIIANRNNTGSRTPTSSVRPENGAQDSQEWQHAQHGAGGQNTTTTNPRPQRRSEGSSESLRPEGQKSIKPNRQYPDWSRNWQEVAFATCDDAMDDGLSRLVDGVPMSRSKWRQNSLKAYGNGIVPQVAIEIMKAIKEQEREKDNG